MKWIKYIDKEPEDGQWVLQLYANGLMGAMKYKSYGPEAYKLVCSDPGPFHDWYWAPRPKLPKGVPQNYPYGDEEK